MARELPSSRLKPRKTNYSTHSIWSTRGERGDAVLVWMLMLHDSGMVLLTLLTVLHTSGIVLLVALFHRFLYDRSWKNIVVHAKHQVYIVRRRAQRTP